MKPGDRVWVNGHGSGVVTSVRKEYPGHAHEGQDVYGVEFERRCSCCGTPKTERGGFLAMHVSRA